MEDTKRIIEINGIKMEVDLRQAKVIENYKVGDYVKILVKGYSDYKSYVGNIIAFDDFAKHPTIVVAYLKTEYNSATIEFAYINSESKDVELTALNSWDIPVTKSTILDWFNKERMKKQEEIREIDNKVKVFTELFGKFFENAISNNNCKPF